MQDNSELSVLLIDPHPGMRGSLQNMLNLAGIGKIEFAVSACTAIRQLARKSYDIILCEYDLGGGADDGQDGQQLLEDLRHHNLIGPLTIFIMITSEAVYGKVVSAAELTPTDYILKPFTIDALGARIDRAILRRRAFLPAYQDIGHGKLREAIRACAQAEAEHSPYSLDFSRLRAELHASLGELAEAAALYSAVLAAKPLGWAGLGLARALFAQERVDEAQAVLARLVAANPKLMAAYDLLARCHEANGAPQRAQRVLEDAVAISPHMVRRLRKLGEVALAAGDAAAAEKSFRQVVARSKYSEFRDPEDHVNLVRALLVKGEPLQAEGVILDLERSLRGNPAMDLCKAISAAMLHEAAGNGAGALAELDTAVMAARAGTAMSSKLRIDLARSCLANKLDQQACDVMASAMNDVGSGVSMPQAMSVFVKAGRSDLAEALGARLKTQAQQLLNVAAEKSGMGDFRGAVQTLLEALHMAPANLAVMIAAANGIVRQIGELGWDHPLGEQCAGLIATIGKLDAAHPALRQLNDDYLAAKRKYGISA